MTMKRMALRFTLALGVTVFVTGLVDAMNDDRATGMMPAAPPYLQSGQQEIGLYGRRRSAANRRRILFRSGSEWK